MILLLWATTVAGAVLFSSGIWECLSAQRFMASVIGYNDLESLQKESDRGVAASLAGLFLMLGPGALWFGWGDDGRFALSAAMRRREARHLHRRGFPVLPQKPRQDRPVPHATPTLTGPKSSRRL